MSTERKISTRLVLEGEREYRDAIGNINRELRVLDSELKLVENQFKGQQNTLVALEAKNKALNDVIAKQTEKLNLEKSAIGSMKTYQDQYAKAAENAKKQLSELAENTDDATKETEEYKNKVKAIEAEIAKYEKAEQQAAAAVDNHTVKMNGAQRKINDLNGELVKNEKHLDEAKNSADGCATSIDATGKEMKETGEAAREMGEKSKAGVDALATALATAGVAASIKAIKEELENCMGASVDFESAMTGVAKTTDLTEQELTAMGEAIKQMALDIPLTTTELGNIMEIGGQLGVSKENLIQFTESMAALGVATNMTSEEAATMLAQIRNITGISEAEYSNLGSAITALGNAFATNERSITDMTKGIAGAGTNAKMSTAQMAGLATAVSSLGIESGTGGTNMSKLIGEIQAAVETGKDLDLWAKAAGMSAKEFARLWRDDAAGAITAFIGNLNHLDQSAIVTLDTLGIGEERMRKMILSLANAEDGMGLLTNTLDLSSKAWEANSALAAEAQLRYATTESKMILFQNSANNLRITIGDQLNPAMRQMIDMGTNVTKWATEFVKTHPEFTRLTVAVTSAGAAFMGVSVALATIVKVWKALSPLLATNPWVMAAGAIAAVAAALISLSVVAGETDADFERLQLTTDNAKKSMTDAEEAYSQTMKGIDTTSAVVDGYIARLLELEGQTSMTGGEQAEYARILQKLQEAMPGLNLEIDEQTGLLKDGASAIKSQSDAWKDLQRTEAGMERRKALVSASFDAEMALVEAQNRRKIASDELDAANREQAESLDLILKMTGKTLEEYEKLGDGDIFKFTKDAWSSIAAGDRQGFNDLLTAYGEMMDANYGLRQEVADLTLIYDAANDVFVTANGELLKYDEIVDGISTTSSQAAEGTEEFSESISQLQEDSMAAIKQMQALEDEYKKSYLAARENISNSIGLFETMKTETKTSIDDMISSLNSQVMYMDVYASNLQKAGEMGLEKGLLAQLADGSTESAAYLQAIVNGGEEKVTALNAAFQRTEEGKDHLATNMAAAETDFMSRADAINQKANEMVENFNQKLQAETNGAETLQGVIDGLNSQKSALQTEINDINRMMSGIGRSYIPLSAMLPAKSESHAAGLPYVPSDNYLANLHEGEMVLTRLQAKAYRAEAMGNYGISKELANAITNNSNLSITVQVMGGGSEGRKIGSDAAAALQRDLRRRGIVNV